MKGMKLNMENNEKLDDVCNYIVQRISGLIKPKKVVISPWFNAKRFADMIRDELYKQPDIDDNIKDRLFSLFSRQSWLNNYVELELNNNYAGVYNYLRSSLEKDKLPTNIIAPGGDRKGSIFSYAESLKQDPKEIMQLGENPVPMDRTTITSYKGKDNFILQDFKKWGRSFTIIEVGEYYFKNGYGQQDDYHINKYILEIDNNRGKQYELYGRLSKMYLTYPGAIETVLRNCASFTEEELDNMNHYIGSLVYRKDENGNGHTIVEHKRSELFAAKAAKEYEKSIPEHKYYDRNGKGSLYLTTDNEERGKESSTDDDELER